MRKLIVGKRKAKRRAVGVRSKRIFSEIFNHNEEMLEEYPSLKSYAISTREKIILESFRNPKYEMRTVRGISEETKIPPSDVKQAVDYLVKINKVAKTRYANQNGETLYVEFGKTIDPRKLTAVKAKRSIGDSIIEALTNRRVV